MGVRSCSIFPPRRGREGGRKKFLGVSTPPSSQPTAASWAEVKRSRPRPPEPPAALLPSLFYPLPDLEHSRFFGEVTRNAPRPYLISGVEGGCQPLLFPSLRLART